MPKIVERLVSQLKAKGMDEGKAQATARKVLQKSGSLKAHSDTLTKKGEARSKMGAAGRAKDRAAKETGHAAKSFKYNQLTNRARLKNG
jgi:hypothetical protein